MDYQAFTAGVKPGGLTRDYEIKILICYLLAKVKSSMSFYELNDVLQSEGVVNYFEYAEAISELLASGHLVAVKRPGGEESYRLTDLGLKTAVTFEKTIPLTVRENTVKATEQYLLRKRIEKENQVEITKVEDGYQMTIRITDIGSDLMNLSMFIPTLKECQAIKDRFLQDPAVIYRGMIALLTGDHSTVRLILAQKMDEEEGC